MTSFQFADVNAFLTLAATQHTLGQEDLDGSPNVRAVVDAAKAGKVPVKLVSSTCKLGYFYVLYLSSDIDLSGKNPLRTLSSNATLFDVLSVFSQGTHRVVIYDHSTAQSSAIGHSSVSHSREILSDRHTLLWLIKSVSRLSSPSIEPLLSAPLSALQITMNDVVFIPSNSSVLEAMTLMSSDGLSSLPIVDAVTGCLLSIVSVNDIGKVGPISEALL